MRRMVKSNASAEDSGVLWMWLVSEASQRLVCWAVNLSKQYSMELPMYLYFLNLTPSSNDIL